MKKFLSILLAVMMVLSTVSFAAPSLAGTADSAVEIPLDNLYEEVVEDTADLAADLSEDSSTYGNLLFELNFNNLTTLDAQSILFTDAGVVTEHAHSYLAELGNISFSAYPTYAVKERAAGDKYLELSGGTGYAVVLLGSGSAHSFCDEGGVYTLTADVYRPDAMPITTRFSGPSSEDTPIQDFTALNDSGWGSMILQHDPSCFGNGGHATPFTSTADVRNIKFHRNGGTDEKTVGYDNIRLYWKPLTVEATVTADGVTKKVEVSTAGATAADFISAFDLDFNKTATGVVINGVTYGSTDTIYLAADCEAEVVVEELDKSLYDYEKGMVLYNIDFEQSEIGTEIPASNGEFKVGSYATSTANVVMSHDPNNWHLNSSGLTYSVVADPANASNKVAGVTGATSTGYPALILNTYSNGAAARYGFIEDPDIVLTIEYDYYDTTADGIALRFGGRSSVSENEGYEKWTTVEDTCIESNSGRVASAWYKNTGVYSAANASRMGGTDEISFVKMHNASPTNADIYYDNIKLYYKPTTARININGGVGASIANATLEGVTTTGILVSELLDDAGLEYDKYMYKLSGVSFTGDSKVYAPTDTISFAGDSTINVVLEEVDLEGWVDAEKGYLLFDIDFNDASAVTLFTPETANKDYKLVDFASKVNPNFVGSENWKLSSSGMDVVGIEDGALKIQWDGTGKYPQVLIGNPSNTAGNELVGENGYYYVHAEYKLLDSVDANLSSIAVQSNGFIDGVHKGPSGILGMGNSFYASQSTLTAGTWLTIEGASKSTWTNDTDGIDNDDIAKITTVFTHSATTGTVGNYYLMDNIKLWWKPANVKLTVYGGSNEDYETVTLTVPTTATIDELVALLPEDTEYGKITGLADMDGNKIDSFSVMSNTSLVAVWSPWVIVDGGQEFTLDESNGPTKTQYNGSYGYVGEMGDGGGDVTTAVRTMYRDGWYTTGGNLFRVQTLPKMGDAENGTLTSPVPYSIPAVHSVNGEIRDNINTSLAAGNDAEYILVKYRYTNLPDLAELVANNTNPEGYEYTLSDDGNSITYLDRKGDSRTATLVPTYGAKYYIKRPSGSYEYAGGHEMDNNMPMVEGEWNYDFIPMTANLTTDGVAQVLIQRENLFDGQVTEYDYVRFVKLGAEEEVVLPEIPGAPVTVDAPASLEDQTSMRMEEGKENGLRFKATMTAEANDAAATIGWVVVSYDKFMASNSSYDALAVDTEGAMLGYQRLEGTDLVNFFDTSSDDALVFAATLKGIPEDNYASYIIVRPFINVDGEYIYGNAFSTCMYDIASAIYYDDAAFSELTDEQMVYIEDIVIYCEDNGLV